MLEILQTIIVHTPVFVPQFLGLVFFWVLAGWFYTEVLGKEIHDFIVFTILIVITLFTLFIFVNKDIQLLFFGSY